MSAPVYVDEYNLIRDVLLAYIEGCVKADSSIMKPSFHEQATVVFVDGEGRMVQGPVEQILFAPVDNDFEASPDAESVIARIDIVGNAASARVDTNNLYGFSFTDFFHLLKSEGEWKIVNKAFHTHG